MPACHYLVYRAGFTYKEGTSKASSLLVIILYIIYSEIVTINAREARHWFSFTDCINYIKDHFASTKNRKA